jgi:hypothetical protein
VKSEKFGAIIYYKHLKILEEAQLTDDQIGKILIAAIRYDETGECPQFSNPLSAFFTMIKYDLDANREKWDEIRTKRSKTGKQGGRPPQKAKKPIGFGESKKTNWLFDGEDERVSIHDIISEAKNNGFFIDDGAAKDFLECDLDKSWLIAPYSYIEFIAEYINEKYSDKPNEEKKAIFISGMKKWKDRHYEYPKWKNNKENQGKEKMRKALLKEAIEKHPTECSCGKKLEKYDGKYYCRECGILCEFQEENFEWKWRKWE